MSSHQEQKYDQLQGSRPCVGRGEHILQIEDRPASGCCKAKRNVIGSKFFCSILNKFIFGSNVCWTCTKRKES